MKRCNIMITGFGTVGKHVARLLFQRQARYREQYGADVRLVGITRSASGIQNQDGLDLKACEAFSKQEQLNEKAFSGIEFAAACEADVLIETGPSQFETGDPGLQYIRHALERGMHAIAVSKGALVVDYAGLSALAKDRGVMLKISGATAAALPTIDLMQYNLAGCEILAIEGIFTGTTNFVLTSMMEEGLSCEEAVSRAQQMGITEPDPTFDIDGWDTACKVTILANAVFNGDLKLMDLPRMSIREVTAEQITEWKQNGKQPKLVGSIRKTHTGIIAEVSLQAVDSSHPFAHVRGTTKAIRVETDVMGELLVVGGKSDPIAAAAAALKDLEHILSQ
jgi:homoserine dehydrogenase